jgi:hypothetical protein
MRAGLLRMATFAEAALAFGVCAIARTARPGGGDDLIEKRGAVRVAGHRSDDFDD